LGKVVVAAAVAIVNESSSRSVEVMMLCGVDDAKNLSSAQD